jgi:hypothetical protein
MSKLKLIRNAERKILTNKKEARKHKGKRKSPIEAFVTICTNVECKLRKKGCKGFEGCPGYKGR